MDADALCWLGVCEPVWTLGAEMTKLAKILHFVGIAVALYVWYWVAILIMAAYG